MSDDVDGPGAPALTLSTEIEVSAGGGFSLPEAFLLPAFSLPGGGASASLVVEPNLFPHLPQNVADLALYQEHDLQHHHFPVIAFAVL